MRLHYVLLLMVLVLPTVYGQGGEVIWLIGFGGEIMLPLLDGGELEARHGETVYLRILGRDGSVTVTAPDQTVIEKELRDGVADPTLTLSTPGTYTIRTDDGQTLTIKAGTAPSIPIVLSTEILPNGLVEISLQQPSRGYVLFQSSHGGSDIYRPGETMMILLETDLTGPYKVSLLRPGGPLVYRGQMAGRPFTLTTPLLVAEYTVRVVESDGRKGLVIKLPGLGEPGPGGLEPLRLGPLIIQVSAFTGLEYSRIMEKMILVVSPSLNPSQLSTAIRFNASEGVKAYQVVVGDELGGSTYVTVMPPLAWVKVYDILHKTYLQDARIGLSNSESRSEGETILLTYFSLYTFSEYQDFQILTPTRKASIEVLSMGFKTEPVEATLQPGITIELPVTLYHLYVDLVFPNGTSFPGEALIEINSKRFNVLSGRYLSLPHGDYFVRSITPQSFTTTALTLDADKHITIYLVDDAIGLSILRASAILLTGIMAYQVYHIWSRRNTVK